MQLCNKTARPLATVQQRQPTNITFICESQETSYCVQLVPEFAVVEVDEATPHGSCKQSSCACTELVRIAAADTFVYLMTCDDAHKSCAYSQAYATLEVCEAPF